MQKARPTANKRLRERQRADRRKEKAQRRVESNARRAQAPPRPTGEDPDIAVRRQMDRPGCEVADGRAQRPRPPSVRSGHGPRAGTGQQQRSRRGDAVLNHVTDDQGEIADEQVVIPDLVCG